MSLYDEVADNLWSDIELRTPTSQQIDKEMFVVSYVDYSFLATGNFYRKKA